VLAAYRRDDWPTGGLSALRRHLERCADCRRVEAEFRGVGERIRRLPSIAPSASMRANVFAAIAAEERRVAPAMLVLSRATTDPALPIVRLTRRPPRRDPLHLGLRAGLIAAAVALTFLAASFMPGVAALSRIASSFAQGPSATVPQGQAHRSLRGAQKAYAVPTLLADETPAMATDAWLAFASVNGAEATLYVEDRQSRARTALSTGDASLLPTLRALTDGWALWTTGSGTSGPWTLSARRLPASAGGANVALASSGEGGLTSLTGVWVGGDSALLTGETADGTGELLRIDLATGARTALASAAGHYYANPTAMGGVAYWSDVAFDTLRGLRGMIEQLGDGGRVAAVSPDTHRFAPLVAGDSLAWVAVTDDRLMAAASGFTALSAESGEAMLFQLTGEVEVGGNGIGSGDAALAPYLAAGGDLIVWRTAGGWHCYDLGGKAPVDGLAGASDVAITDTAVVWTEGANATTLYVAPTR
jgi:hypothetical protein